MPLHRPFHAVFLESEIDLDIWWHIIIVFSVLWNAMKFYPTREDTIIFYLFYFFFKEFIDS